jgi:hypothetical protein
MSFAEISCRARQQLAKWWDRTKPVSVDPAVLVGRRAPALAEIDAPASHVYQTLAQRFFPGPLDPRTVGVLSDCLPGVRADLVRVADGICQGRVSLLGYDEMNIAEPIDWHRDPVANRRVPMVHWSRIDPLDFEAVGDSKVVWELNRHQWLVTLAQAYSLTGDRRYSDQVMRILTHWTLANPYGFGINWASSLEVAFRLIAWIWVFALLRPIDGASTEQLTQFLAYVWLHATHIERYLSYYFSPNTHLTGEALGLFYAGVLFPDFADAARWRDLGRRILVEESKRQMLPGGVYMEQATCYQRYTVEIYLHFLILAERAGLDVPADVRSRVESLLAFLVAVSGADGSVAPIGDEDGGWLLPLARRSPRDCRGVFALGAVLFNREDFAWAADGPAPELLWILGPGGFCAFNQVTPRPPTELPSRAFRPGGYVVMRSGWSRNAHRLIMDVGPLGCALSGAHGHADLLSIQCFPFGDEYLVDPGTYCYTRDRRWRDYFRSSLAHNTVVVDGESQALPTGPFQWRDRPVARLREWSTTKDIEVVDADHDAYGRLADPVSHRRRIIFVRRRYWVVIDDLIGGAPHSIELRYQFAARIHLSERLPLAAAPGQRGEGLWLMPFSTTTFSTAVRYGEEHPASGWVSAQYGKRCPAPVLIYSLESPLPVRFVTLLFPVDPLESTPPAAAPVYGRSGSLIGLRVADQDGTVMFDPRCFLSHDVPVRTT